MFFLFSACSNTDVIEEEPIDYDALNEIEIQEYISDNSLNPKKSSTGLYYIIKNEGTGKNPSENSTITVAFKSYDTNNIIFEETEVEGVDFKMDAVIEGFKEGMTYLKEEGEATFIIPSKLAYASAEYHPLRYSVLIFDVKLLKVK